MIELSCFLTHVFYDFPLFCAASRDPVAAQIDMMTGKCDLDNLHRNNHHRMLENLLDILVDTISKRRLHNTWF